MPAPAAAAVLCTSVPTCAALAAGVIASLSIFSVHDADGASRLSEVADIAAAAAARAAEATLLELDEKPTAVVRAVAAALAATAAGSHAQQVRTLAARAAAQSSGDVAVAVQRALDLVDMLQMRVAERRWRDDLSSSAGDLHPVPKIPALEPDPQPSRGLTCSTLRQKQRIRHYHLIKNVNQFCRRPILSAEALFTPCIALARLLMLALQPRPKTLEVRPHPSQSQRTTDCLSKRCARRGKSSKSRSRQSNAPSTTTFITSSLMR